MTARLLSGAPGPFRRALASAVASSAAPTLAGLPAELAPAAPGLLDQLTDELACLAAPTLLRVFSQRPGRRAPSAERCDDHDAYCGWLESGGLDEVLGHHPGLPPLLDGQVERWRERTGELVRVVAEHGADLVAVFGFRPPVVGVHPLVNGSLRLDDASGASVVWKRRPVDVDVAFARLIDQVTSTGEHHRFPAPPMLDLGPSGLCGVIDQRPPRTPGDWSDLAEHFGTLLAVATLLGATDLHVHNVLVDGHRPVVVDAEAVIRPPWDTDDRRPSVIGTGLVPVDGFVAEAGLAAALGLDHPTPWCDLGTDAVRPRPVRPTQVARAAEARQAFARVDPVVAHTIVDAFERTARRVLDEGLPLEVFEGTRPRVLLRPSVGYEDTMLAALDPSVLADGGGPAALIRDRLASPPPPLAGQPDLAATVRRGEIDALSAFVFPRFTMPATGGSLRCGDDDLGVTAPFEAPLDRARHLLDTTTTSDVDILAAELADLLAPLIGAPAGEAVS